MMNHRCWVVTPIAELVDTRAELVRVIAELDEEIAERARVAARQGFGVAAS